MVWKPYTQPILQLIAQENGHSFCFSGLLLKQSLGLIQLIKIQLMFVLIAPQRQSERQASIIPASEASALGFYGLQMDENSPTIPRSVGISLIHIQTFSI